MAIKYTNISNNSKALKIYPNWDFWFENKASGKPGYHPVLNTVLQALSHFVVEKA
jgi:hypothetical protein